MEKNISKAKVLVCDDSMMVRNKMKKLLTAYGFTQIFEASCWLGGYGRQAAW